MKLECTFRYISQFVVSTCTISTLGAFVILAASSNAQPSDATLAAGKALFLKSCAMCHKADGKGTPLMQPSLDGSPVVLGDPTVLIRVMLEGPEQALPPERTAFPSSMPGYPQLKDEEIAQVLTYLRNAYAQKASEITPEQVKSVRANSKP